MNIVFKINLLFLGFSIFTLSDYVLAGENSYKQKFEEKIIQESEIYLQSLVENRFLAKEISKKIFLLQHIPELQKIVTMQLDQNSCDIYNQKMRAAYNKYMEDEAFIDCCGAIGGSVGLCIGSAIGAVAGGAIGAVVGGEVFVQVGKLTEDGNVGAIARADLYRVAGVVHGCSIGGAAGVVAGLGMSENIGIRLGRVSGKAIIQATDRYNSSKEKTSCTLM